MTSPQQRRKKPAGKRFFRRRKVCQFCVDKVTISYKDVQRNRRFISEWGKIESRRKTGTCSPHQRQLSLAIKRGRFLGWLPYTGSHSLMDLARSDPRGDRGRRPFRGDAPQGAPPSAPPDGAAVADPAVAGLAAAEAVVAEVSTAEGSAAEAPAAEVAVAEAPAAEVAVAEEAVAEVPVAEVAVAEAPAEEAEAPAEEPQEAASETQPTA